LTTFNALKQRRIKYRQTFFAFSVFKVMEPVKKLTNYLQTVAISSASVFIIITRQLFGAARSKVCKSSSGGN